MVLVSHLSEAPAFITLPSEAPNLLGDTGVRVFFVLSGFLITTLLITEHARTGRVDIFRFYVRRCFRIFPAFYLYLGVLLVLSVSGWITLRSGDLAKAALYVVDYFPWNSTSNFVRHIWSLSVEEQFYLIWPVTICVLGLRRAKWVALASIVISPVWRIAVLHWFPVFNLTLPRRFDCISDALATGCLLACLHPFLATLDPYRRMLQSRWMHVLPIAVLLAAATSFHPHIYYGFLESVMNLGIALYMHYCIFHPPRILNIAMVRWLGLMSYSIYLWQQLFCAPNEGLIRLAWYAAVPLTLGAASLSYYLVEHPMQRLGHRLTARIPARETQVVFR